MRALAWRRIAAGLLLLGGTVIAAGAGWEWWARRRAWREMPPPGRLVDIGGRRLQLDCRGSGAPTVVLVAGLDMGGALAWSTVHDSLARTTRTCAYSRAGIMWSDPDPAFVPRHAAQDLVALLRAAGEPGPVVLVGHSLGGPISMLVVQHAPALVAGLVFVDASHPDQLARFAKIGIAEEASGTGLLQRAARLSRTGLVRVHMGGVSPFPGEDPALARTRAAYRPLSVQGAAAESAALGAILREAGARRTLDARPLVVLTAMAGLSAADRAALGVTEDQAAAEQREWLAMHEDEARWSTDARHELVPGAGHYIQFDRPDVVIRAVRDVVTRVRPGVRTTGQP